MQMVIHGYKRYFVSLVILYQGWRCNVLGLYRLRQDTCVLPTISLISDRVYTTERQIQKDRCFFGEIGYLYSIHELGIVLVFVLDIVLDIVLVAMMVLDIVLVYLMVLDIVLVSVMVLDIVLVAVMVLDIVLVAVMVLDIVLVYLMVLVLEIVILLVFSLVLVLNSVLVLVLMSVIACVGACLCLMWC